MESDCGIWGPRRGNKRMKNERCMEFWWDKGTGSVITKIVTTCAPPLDYKRERSVWGVWLHVPAEAIRGSTCRDGIIYTHLIWRLRVLMNKQRCVWILLSTRGCSSRKANNVNIWTAEFSKLSQSLMPYCHKAAKRNRACLNLPEEPAQTALRTNSQGWQHYSPPHP